MFCAVRAAADAACGFAAGARVSSAEDLCDEATVASGSSAQAHWQTWTLWRNGGDFGVTDAQFGKDISFFAFDYPMYRLVLGFCFSAVIFA